MTAEQMVALAISLIRVASDMLDAATAMEADGGASSPSPAASTSDPKRGDP